MKYHAISALLRLEEIGLNLNSTYRVPLLSAVTAGLLFCATPAVAASTPEPSPTALESPSVPSYEDPNLPSEATVAPNEPTALPQDPDVPTDELSVEVQGENITSFSGLESGSFEELSDAEEPSTFANVADGDEILGSSSNNETSVLADEDSLGVFGTVFPEGSENWDDAQWDAYLQTPEGEAFLNALEEYWSQFEALFPEGSENWDDNQWDAFLQTPEGEAFLDDFFDLLFPDLNEAEVEELLAFLDALLAELLYALEGEDLNWETTQQSPTPNTVATDTTTDAQPAAATTASTPTESALATTGSDGVWTLVGLGVLLSLLGFGLVAGQRRLQARKASTRH